MKKILVSLMLLLVVGIMAQAQENKEYEAAMSKMLEVSKSMDAMKQIAPQITAMLKQQAGGQLPDEFLKELETEIVSMYDRMIKAMLPIYQKYLSLQDIQGIITFYESPIGKKLAESNTKIAVEIMPIAQQIGMETMQKLMKNMEEKGYLKK